MNLEIIQVLSTRSARPVMDTDIPRILTDAPQMAILCNKKIGHYENGSALAHNQVCQYDPLKFYVDAMGYVIVNPRIVKHTHHTVDSVEGCLSYAHRPSKKVQRWNKIEYLLQRLEKSEEGKYIMTEPELFKASGHEAFVVQHEVDHLDGIDIYQLN